VKFTPVLPVVMSFFTGSRSTAFRLVTAFLCEYLVLYGHHLKTHRRGSIKQITSIVLILLGMVLLFSVVLNYIGRNTNIDTFQYFVAYIGGPFINLDLFLQTYNGSQISHLFGQETFQRFYSFVGSVLNIDWLRYELHLPYNWLGGIFLGNVCTMYYMFIEDFGYFGVPILTAVVACFYNIGFEQLRYECRENRIIGPGLWIYSYLFNDVLMLTFSNRFFENAISSATIRMYFWIAILWVCFKRGLFRIRIGHK
jgi:oligosaccharide repeat unit polymerase